MIKSFTLVFKIAQISIHLLYGLTVISIISPKNGINNSKSASSAIIKWNIKLCKIFNADVLTQGKMNDQATLYVMNHISWFDIPVVASQQTLHFLSKAEIKKWPLIGSFAVKVGTLFIQRGAKGAAENSLNEITQRLKDGGNVIVFPEGTTTDGATLKKFHSRLLQAAINAQVAIQPIALRYPGKLETVNQDVAYVDDTTFIESVIKLIKSKNLNVELHFLEPIDDHLHDTNTHSSKQLAETAKQAIAKKLNIKI